MSAAAATRTELMKRRAGITFARQGRDLLIDKRMALVRELRRLDVDMTEELARARTLARQALAQLRVALAEEGDVAVESVALGAASGVKVEGEDRTVVGVRVVTVRAPDVRRPAERRGSAPALVAPSIAAATEAYERYLEQVLRSAALEATARRLTLEISRTTRQVNALENVVIPVQEREVARIAAVLDEREREEHARLKRVRDRRRAAAVAGARVSATQPAPARAHLQEERQ